MQPPILKTPISFWAKEESPLTHYKSTSRLPSNADIVIIGSGFTGASIAHHLPYNDGRTVVMLEARDLCSGASGRNGGHLAPNYLSDQIEFELLNVDELMQVIDEFDVLKEQCYVHKGVGYYIFETEDAIRIAQSRLAELGRRGVDIVGQLRLVDASVVRRELGIEHGWPISGAIIAPTSPINPYKLVDFLIQRAVAKGLNLYTGTRATRLETKNGRTRIETSGGQVIIAEQVILATNAYTGAISNVFARDIMPVRGQVSRWSIPNEQLTLKLKDFKVSIGIGDEYLAVVPESDTRVSLVLGGLRRYVDGAQVGIDDDNELDATISRELKSKMRQITGIDRDADEQWTGIMGFTRSGVPYIGEVTKGVVVAAGFGGHGMPRIFLTGKAVVERFVHGGQWPEWFPMEYRLNESCESLC